jgi:hypothetical protein
MCRALKFNGKDEGSSDFLNVVMLISKFISCYTVSQPQHLLYIYSLFCAPFRSLTNLVFSKLYLFFTLYPFYFTISIKGQLREISILIHYKLSLYFSLLASSPSLVYKCACSMAEDQCVSMFLHVVF